MNLVLDECLEHLQGEGGFSRINAGPLLRRASAPRLVAAAILLIAAADPADPLRTTAQTRSLGLIVCRGPQVTVVLPEEGMQEIANPFADDGDGAAAGDVAMGE